MADLLLKILRQTSYARLQIRNDLIRRSMGTLFLLRWRYWLKTCISIPWPYGWTPPDHLGNSSQSSDPDVWYRDWLEKHVGQQGWAWDWRYKFGATIESPGYEHLYNDQIEIKFRKPKHASMFLLKYGSK